MNKIKSAWAVTVDTDKNAKSESDMSGQNISEYEGRL